MTIRVDLIGHAPIEPVGYVQVNPYEYEYTGSDDDLLEYFQSLDEDDVPYASPYDEGEELDDPTLSEKDTMRMIVGKLRTDEAITAILFPDGVDDI